MLPTHTTREWRCFGFFRLVVGMPSLDLSFMAPSFGRSRLVSLVGSLYLSPSDSKKLALSSFGLIPLCAGVTLEKWEYLLLNEISAKVYTTTARDIKLMYSICFLKPDMSNSSPSAWWLFDVMLRWVDVIGGWNCTPISPLPPLPSQRQISKNECCVVCQHECGCGHGGRKKWKKLCTCCALIRLQLYRKEESGKRNSVTSGHSLSW